jgi:hypothetical protein
MKQITLIIAALAFLTIYSCKKEEKKSKTDLLTASAWKPKSMIYDPIDDVPVDEMEDCEKDDTFKFNVGGTGIKNVGTVKCNQSEPQTEPLTWAFGANETQLIIDGETWSLVTLDANTLVIRISEVGDTYTVTMVH